MLSGRWLSNKAIISLFIKENLLLLFPAFASVHCKTNSRKCNSAIIWLILQLSCLILEGDGSFLSEKLPLAPSYFHLLCSPASRIPLKAQNIEFNITSSYLFCLLPGSRHYRATKGTTWKLQTRFASLYSNLRYACT